MRHSNQLQAVLMAAILIFMLFPAGMTATIPQGSWYCIQATYEGITLEDFEATFSILDNTYYEADFEMDYSYGESKSQYSYSGTAIFQTRMPEDVNNSGGGSWTSGDVLIYDYMAGCTQEIWDQAGKTALGCGLPAGQSTHRILYSISGDTLLVLKSPDEKTVLTYTFGAKRPAHNFVIFQVNMKVQQQLGNFKPVQGDKVVIRGTFNGWSGKAYEMQELDTDGIYQISIDFPGSQVGIEQEFKYVIVGGSEIMESDPDRSFILEPDGQNLGMDYFDRRARIDDVHAIAVAQRAGHQYSPAAAYNPGQDEFLVVWIDESDVIRGQRLKSDGTLAENSFRINGGDHFQDNPDVAFNSVRNEWMVVWEDERDGDYDIHGARLGSSGQKLASPGAGADSSFAVCSQDSTQEHPKIAYNDIDDCFLVVWEDSRNSEGYWGNADIYGQRISGTGELLLPGDTQNAAVNFPIAGGTFLQQRDCDVGYCGRTDKILNEWLVVYESSSGYYGEGRIWGVRIKGNNGARLDTWGNEAAVALTKPEGAAGPPWYPEFPIGWDNIDFSGKSYTDQDCPRVASNDAGPGGMHQTLTETHPVPEYLVAWTEYLYEETDGDIKAQRVAFFSDSAAFRLGLKPTRGADTMFTAVMLDQNGDWPKDPASWMTWPNFHVTQDGYEQYWNDLDYNSDDGTFFIVWNDWRKSGWNGEWDNYYYNDLPPADIYGQRIYINPGDSSIIWIDHDGSWSKNIPIDVPVAFTDADEGHDWYQAVVHASSKGSFLVAYEYLENPEWDDTDIQAVIYKGIPPIRSDVADHVQPESFGLLQNYPNPFNPKTHIRYALEGETGVTLKIYDILGRETAILVNRRQQAGSHEAEWNGLDARGLPAASGVYFIQLIFEKGGGSTTFVKKMVLAR